MRIHTWTALVSGVLVTTLVTPAFGLFEAFSKLAEELEAMERSSPEGLSELLEKLEDSETKFNDVGSGDWFHRYVSSAARWGIVTGYKDAAGKPTGAFGPGNTVTVAEILKMALKAAQVDDATCRGSPSLTQAERHWARPFVVCAEQRGVRLLTSAPDLNRPALRGEVLSVVFDAFGDKVPPLFAPFKDTENHPLESDIAYAAALKIISGDKDKSGNPTGTFRPNAPVNRAEAAKIIYERLRVEVMGEEQ
ncbi:MAG: S-layer homology domain-containing protein [Candidatus Peregrinibacteria bacterium]|nr:S-layer homology domain-containing protein [Candidatus Peregrinibacteria bacterium]